MEDDKVLERLTKILEKLAPYIVGTTLVIFWFIMNYATLVGETMLTGHRMAPTVSPEIVGRILGYIDSACILFLTWVYSSSKSANDANKAVSNALANSQPKP